MPSLLLSLLASLAPAMTPAPPAASAAVAPAAPTAPQARGKQAAPKKKSKARREAEAEAKKQAAEAEKERKRREKEAKAKARERERDRTQSLAQLTATEKAVAEALLVLRPSELRAAGYFHPGTSWRGDAEHALAWRNALDLAAGSLAELDPIDFEPERRDDLLWLRSFVEAQRIVDSSMQSLRRDPTYHLAELESGLRAIAERRGLSADERMQLAIRQLDAMPHQLTTARSTLGYPELALTETALLHVHELAWLVDVELARFLERDGLTPSLWRPFEVSQASASAALEEFRAWLAATIQKERHPRHMAQQSWITLVELHTGVSLDTAALKAQLLRDTATMDLQLGERRVPTPPAPEELAPAALRQRMLEALETAGSVLTQTRIVTTPPPRIEVLSREAYALTEPVVRVVPEDDAFTLILTYRGIKWPPAVQAARALRMGAPAQRALALRHGVPGEALWDQWSAANPRITQSLLRNRAQREGWGLFAADWITRFAPEVNPLAEDEELRIEVHRQRQLEAGRLLAALEIHALDSAEEDTVDLLCRSTGLDRESALREVRTARRDPLHGVGYLSYLQFLEVEKHGASLPPQLRNRRLFSLVAQSPSFPVALVELPEIVLPAEKEEPGAAPAGPGEGRRAAPGTGQSGSRARGGGRR